MKKRVFAMFLVLCLIFTQEGMLAFASELQSTLSEEQTSGTLGDNGGFLWTYDDETETLTVTGEDTGLARYFESPFMDIDPGVQKVVFENCTFIEDMSYLLSFLEWLEVVEFNHCDTSSVTNMEGLFMQSYNLKEIDIRCFDTSNVTNMSWMFSGCGQLENVDLSGFNTFNVVDMSNLFHFCHKIESWTMSDWDTSNVTNMAGMYSACRAESLDISYLETSNVTNVKSMFSGCSALTDLNISSFDTSNFVNTRAMFYGCSSLTHLDMRNFDLSNVSTMGDELVGCTSLITINLPKAMPEQGSMELPGEFYDSQMNLHTEITSENCNKKLVKNQQDEGEQIDILETFLLQVVDEDGKPVAGATVTYDDQTSQTNLDGMATFILSKALRLKLTVEKEGYVTSTNWNQEYGFTIFTNNVKIILREEKPEQLSFNAVYLDDATNLLIKTKTFNLKQRNADAEEFSIRCQLATDAEVAEYQLWQKDKKIATSTEGLFSLKLKDGFVEGSGCFVRVIPVKGEVFDQKINLSFISKEIKPSDVAVIQRPATSLDVDENVPFFGGEKLEIKIPNLPITLEVTDEKIYVGFNVEPCKSSEGDGVDSTDKEKDDYYKQIKQLVDSAKKSQAQTASAIQNIIKSSESFKLPGGKFETTIVGYAEAEWGSSVAKGGIYLSVKGTSPTLRFQTFVSLIPVVVEFEATAEGTLGGKLSFDFEKSEFVDAGIDFKLKGALTVFGGVGIGDLAGGGAYGEAAITTVFRLLGNDEGLQKIDLTGELGIKVYAGPFTHERAFAKKTWNIWSANTIKTFEKTCYKQADIYDAKNYKKESLAYLKEESEWYGYATMPNDADANTKLSVLLENTYRNAQPVMISDGNTIYATFLRADEATENVHAVCTKLENGVWSEPVQVDAFANWDDAPQLLMDEDGTLWMAYATTLADADKTSLLSYAQNQRIVIGTVDKDTLAFTHVKTYESSGYACKQQLALVDGVPTLVWVEASVTDDDSVLASNLNKVFVASLEEGVWSEGREAIEVDTYLKDLAIGEMGIACIIDADKDLASTEDATLMVYDWTGNETASQTGVTGNLTYGVLPGETEATFLWNGIDQLCTLENTIEVLGITREYAVCGDSIYYSISVDGGAELAVLKKNSDGSFGTYIQLTESERYLENLSAATIGDVDVVFGMHTDVTIEEEAVIPEKNLVWAIVQPVSDLRIDVVDYDATTAMPETSVPVKVTITNAGDHKVEELSIYVDNVQAMTECVDLQPGQRCEMMLDITCPTDLTRYTLQVVETAGDISMDYTPEDNAATVTLGYGNLCIDAKLQEIGESRLVAAEVMNDGIATMSGTVALYDEEGQLLSMSSFTDLASGNVVFMEMPIPLEQEDTTLSVVITTEQEELYTYDNTDSVFVSERAKKYTIIYVLNGGVQNQSNSDIYYKSNEAVTLYAPTRKGYTFMGWYSDEGFEQQVTELAAGTTGDKTLYAQWSLNKYTIKFDGNGATSGKMSSLTSRKYGTTYTLSANAFARKGYTFLGWNTKADGTGTSYTDKAKVKSLTSVNGKTITLYAQWSVNKYTIKFDGNGATSGKMSSLTNRKYGTTYTLSANAFERKGYTFLGWNTKANGKGTSYKNKAKVKSLTSTKGKTITLYAQWKKNDYSITYKLNGGKNNKTNPTKYTVTTSTITLKNPTRKGYTFKGWYSDAKYKTKVTIIKKGSIGSKTFYAKWSVNKYTIKFNGNKSTSGKMSSLSGRKYGTTYTLTANAFKRKGYTFIGWNTRADGKGISYKNKAKIKNLTSTNGKTITLYAQWKKNNYSITYKLNGGKNNKKNPSKYTVTTSTFTLKNPTRKGYTFKGWYSDKKYKKKVTKVKKGSTGSITLYAKWVKKK